MSINKEASSVNQEQEIKEILDFSVPIHEFSFGIFPVWHVVYNLLLATERNERFQMIIEHEGENPRVIFRGETPAEDATIEKENEIRSVDSMRFVEAGKFFEKLLRLLSSGVVDKKEFQIIVDYNPKLNGTTSIQATFPQKCPQK